MFNSGYITKYAGTSKSLKHADTYLWWRFNHVIYSKSRIHLVFRRSTLTINISTADRRRNLALDLIALKNAEFSIKFIKLMLLNKKSWFLLKNLLYQFSGHIKFSMQNLAINQINDPILIQVYFTTETWSCGTSNSNNIRFLLYFRFIIVRDY
jgi:hypothetical protein